MKDGAEFVGEAFVLTVSASIVIWEYNRSAQKHIEKNEQKRERIRADQSVLQAKLHALDIRIKAVEDLIKKQQNLDDKGILERVATVSKKPKYVEPPKEELVPIVDDDDNKDGVNNDSTRKGAKESGIDARNKKDSDFLLVKVSEDKHNVWWKFW